MIYKCVGSLIYMSWPIFHLICSQLEVNSGLQQEATQMTWLFCEGILTVLLSYWQPYRKYIYLQAEKLISGRLQDYGTRELPNYSAHQGYT